jgi:hypothetical protein
MQKGGKNGQVAKLNGPVPSITQISNPHIQKGSVRK